MNKQEYMEQLKLGLRRLPAEEYESAIQYYTEYFEDAGPENEQRVIKELGDPSKLASSILAESMIRTIEPGAKSQKKGLSGVWIAILAVFASPIALPIAIAIAVVAFALVIALCAVIFAFFLTALILGLVGIGVGVLGIVAVFGAPLAGFYLLGGGLFCVGLCIMVAIGTIALTRISFNGISRLVSKNIRRRNIK